NANKKNTETDTLKKILDSDLDSDANFIITSNHINQTNAPQIKKNNNQGHAIDPSTNIVNISGEDQDAIMDDKNDTKPGITKNNANAEKKNNLKL
ncbi:hypothetical protein BB561_006688, partial [Smittium simulii]